MAKSSGRCCAFVRVEEEGKCHFKKTDEMGQNVDNENFCRSCINTADFGSLCALKQQCIVLILL